MLFRSIVVYANANVQATIQLRTFRLRKIDLKYLISRYANYAGCDPLTLGQIKKTDQIGPLFVVQHLSGSGAGLVGLYVSAVFSGSLSTVSSVLNSLSAVVWEDFLKGVPVFTKLSQTSQGWVVKTIGNSNECESGKFKI